MQYNNFEHEQEQDALAFIANETAHINGITPPSHLSDANVWHQLNKTKNTAFIHSYSKGVLNVTIKTLKHGGESWTFSGWDTVQQCRESNHKPLTRTKPATILTNPQAEATEAEKEKKYRKELALFKTLPKTGAFSYLKRKHILDTAQDTGIGFAANRIMIPIYQPNPNPVKRKGLDVVISGLQIIYSKNKIIRGTKKGGFFPLGDLPKAGSKKQLNIFICEGFATGLAIKKVFHDAVVVVAFDTGNMTIISDLMRKLYSKSMVTIAGDYDGATFAKRGKNPGISAAHKAAYKAIGAKVMLPIVEHGSVQNIDFNDVLIDDENGIIQAYQRRVDCDLKIALAGEYEQHKKDIEHDLLSVGIIEELTFNKKCYINNITFPLGYISAIRAGQGTGKTFQALRFANAQKSVLAISHRVSLVKGLQEKANEGMEGKWAVYDKLGGTEMNDKNHLISTLHSAHKFAHSRTKLKPYDVVLLDEIIQQLKELTGSIEYKQAILEVLRFFLSNAKHIILMDADLNSESIRFIQSLAGGKPVKCFYTHQQIGINRNITLTNNATRFHNVLMDGVKNQTAYIATNSLEMSEEIYHKLIKAYPDKDILRINSKTKSNPRQAAYLADVNGVIQPDIVIASPVISTGVSIDVVNGIQRFDAVYGYFETGVNAPPDFLQSLTRPRGFKSAYCYVNPTTQSYRVFESDVMARWTESRQADLELLSISVDGEPAIYSKAYESLKASIEVETGEAMTNIFEGFARHCHLAGFKVGFDYSDSHDKAMLKAMRDAAQAAKDALFFNASNIDKVQADEINKSLSATESDYSALEKFRLKEFYKLQGGDSLEAYYNIDNNGKTRKQLKLLRTVTASGDELTRQAQAMLDHKMRGDYEPLAVKQLFYKTLLEFVEVEATRQGITTSELKYRAVDLSGFVDWVNENRRILRGAIKLPSRAKLRLSVVQYVNSWLLNIGIKPARVKMPGNTWAHCIKKTNINLISDLIIKISGNSREALQE